jgi:cupin fold WbuC family metalloprotein
LPWYRPEFHYAEIVNGVYVLTHQDIQAATSPNMPIMTLPEISNKEYQQDTAILESFLRVRPNQTVVLGVDGSSFLSLTSILGEVSVTVDGLNSFVIGNGANRLLYKALGSKDETAYFSNYNESEALIQLIHTLPIRFINSEKIRSSTRVNVEASSLSISRESAAVFRANSKEKSIEQDDIEFMKTTLLRENLDRARICCHLHDQSLIQEMFIIFSSSSIVPPMKHMDKNESFLLLRGFVDYCFCLGVCRSSQHIKMKGLSNRELNLDLPFYVRIEKRVKHMPIVKENLTIAKETTTGPFKPEETLIYIP